MITVRVIEWLIDIEIDTYINIFPCLALQITYDFRDCARRGGTFKRSNLYQCIRFGMYYKTKLF